MKYHSVIAVCMLCIISLFLSGSMPPDDTYDTDSRMFHIERSLNKNIVCYDFHINSSGMLNVKEPISVYWVNREQSPGKHGSISMLQQQAFGYKVVNAAINAVTVKLNAVKNRMVTIEQNDNGKYVCKTDINNKPSVLQKVYVKTYANNSMKVEYVDIFGTDMQTGASVQERIKP